MAKLSIGLGWLVTSEQAFLNNEKESQKERTPIFLPFLSRVSMQCMQSAILL